MPLWIERQCRLGLGKPDREGESVAVEVGIDRARRMTGSGNEKGRQPRGIDGRGARRRSDGRSEGSDRCPRDQLSPEVGVGLQQFPVEQPVDCLVAYPQQLGGLIHGIKHGFYVIFVANLHDLLLPNADPLGCSLPEGAGTGPSRSVGIGPGFRAAFRRNPASGVSLPGCPDLPQLAGWKASGRLRSRPSGPSRPNVRCEGVRRPSWQALRHPCGPTIG